MNKVISSALLILSLTTALHAQSEFAPQALLKPKFTGLVLDSAESGREGPVMTRLAREPASTSFSRQDLSLRL
jgi:hypothetical protein